MRLVLGHLMMKDLAKVSKNLMSLSEFGRSADNTLQLFLTPESESNSQFTPRQVKNIHFSYVKTEPVPNPYFVAASASCAQSIGLDPNEFTKQSFIDAFSGNTMLPGLDKAYCTVYGCHCYGHWFGQLGDGRAMGIGEVEAKYDKVNSEGQPVERRERYELQLKGCGRSPYSRGFDGRAVMRSSVREYLVSEAMHHLGVPTTRALSIIGTGMTIRRPWYDASAIDRQQDTEVSSTQKEEENMGGREDKFSPNVLLQEPGAILCRVSKSFLRVGQLELFAKRGETRELLQFADYVCYREFPHLLHLHTGRTATDSGDCGSDNSSSSVDSIPPGSVDRYVEMYREIIKGNARLVSEWLRVGYTQGNMNSDNTLLAGRTIDYGPYGWLERFDPSYQPFTSDGEGKFSFLKQPTAMNVNVAVLGESIEVLIHAALQRDGITDPRIVSENIGRVRDLAHMEFERQFVPVYENMRRAKLGLSTTQSDDTTLFSDLDKLLFKSECDYTIFYRELTSVVDLKPYQADQALANILESFYRPALVTKYAGDWNMWFKRYLTRLQNEGEDTETVRKNMNLVNPKYVLRNWMATLAYEKAQENDYSVIEELHELLLNPYDEHSSELAAKWYQKTPAWARNMPGASFMS